MPIGDASERRRNHRRWRNRVVSPQDGCGACVVAKCRLRIGMGLYGGWWGKSVSLVNINKRRRKADVKFGVRPWHMLDCCYQERTWTSRRLQLSWPVRSLFTLPPLSLCAILTVFDTKIEFKNNVGDNDEPNEEDGQREADDAVNTQKMILEHLIAFLEGLWETKTYIWTSRRGEKYAHIFSHSSSLQTDKRYLSIWDGNALLINN